MNVGFIGMGNMAQALAVAFLNSKKCTKETLFAFAPHWEKLEKNAEKIGFTPCATVHELLQNGEIIFLACKPWQIESVLNETKNEILQKAVVSVASGWNFADFEKILGSDFRVLCVKPNTPAMVGEGVFLFEKKHSLMHDEYDFVRNLFGGIGLTEELPAELLAIGGAVSGCGPAFMDMIIEAYADAAVKYGIPRETAYRIVSQTMAGSAKLQLKTSVHPGALKDAVCTPGGITIRGVDALEKNGLRGACISSIDAVMDSYR
jgi:pyrroline-5-carboxylate reductase